MRCLDDWYFGPPGTRAFGYGNIQNIGPSGGDKSVAGTGGMINMAKTVGWGQQHKTTMNCLAYRGQHHLRRPVSLTPGTSRQEKPSVRFRKSCSAASARSATVIGSDTNPCGASGQMRNSVA
jgi:hypothetical protein